MDVFKEVRLSLEKRRTKLEKILKGFEKTSNNELKINRLRGELGEVNLKLFLGEMFHPDRLLEEADVSKWHNEFVEKFYQCIRNFLLGDNFSKASEIIEAAREDNLFAILDDKNTLESDDQLIISLLLIKHLIENSQEEAARLAVNFLTADTLEVK